MAEYLPGETPAQRLGRGPLPASQVIELGMQAAAALEEAQAAGSGADTPGELYRLGEVLYEAATGRGPDPNPVSPLRLKPDLPHELDRILMRALDPDPRRRYQSAADLRMELKRLQREARPATIRRGAPGSRRPRRILYGAAALCLLLAGNWVFDRLSRRSPSAAREARLTDLAGAEIQPSFSPDASQVAFAWQTGRRGDTFHVYVKPVGSGSPRQLTTGAANDVSPAWSPDGRLIAFLRMDEKQAAYYVVPAAGGPERKVADQGPADREQMRRPAIAWTADSAGLVVVVRPAGQAAALSLAPVRGGEAARLTTPSGPPGDGVPAVSPDGAQLAFVRAGAASAGDVYVVAMSGGEPRRLTFDSRPVQGLAWTADGARLVYSSARAGPPALWAVPVSGGSPGRVPGAEERGLQPAVSRDGRRLAYARTVSDINIWRLELAAPEGAPVRWISGAGAEREPQYSPDGKRVAFLAERSGVPQVWVADAGGDHAVQLTSLQEPAPGGPDWSPDGTRILFHVTRRDRDPELWVASAAGGAAPQRVEGVTGSLPSWSRDGKSIYFTRHGQIWKVPAGGGEAAQVTKMGGYGRALESADGKFLYYSNRGAIWWTPLAGDGDESPVSNALRTHGGLWTLGRKGIWFLRRNDSGKTAIRFFDFAARSVETVALLDQPLGRDSAGFTVSPDGRQALYCRMDRSDSDLMIVENFSSAP